MFNNESVDTYELNLHVVQVELHLCAKIPTFYD